MSKILTLAIALLCSTAWVMAQDASQNTHSSAGQTHAAAGHTVEGCLQGSDGNFTLTDKSGTMYQLQGDAAKLSKHVGHEVKITGSPSEAGAASSGGAAQQTLTVSSVKHISETCKNMSK